jgi:hypothetical protein
MARELDETWVEEAIARHRSAERLQAEFDAWVGTAEVSVHSPDELVEVRVGADGSIREVSIGALDGRTGTEVSRSVDAALGAAADAADWARRTLYAEAVRVQGPGRTSYPRSDERDRRFGEPAPQ